MHQLSRQIQDSMQHLSHSHLTCLSTAAIHCLEMGGEHARPQHLRLMLDCAATCAFTAEALARKSQFHAPIAALCADVCDTCAQDCAAIGGMEDCVEACRACALACRQIAGMEHAAILERASATPPSRHAGH